MEPSKYVVESANVADLAPHPLSDQIFGQLPNDRFRDLLEDIDRRGLKYPLEQDAHGRIIAGSQRLRAIKELGWKIVSVIRHPELTDEPDIEEYLIKDNTLRRQLTFEQIYLAGSRLERIYRLQAEANAKAGVPLPPEEGKVERHGRDTFGKVASSLSVSRRRYEDVKTVFEKGSTAVQDKLRAGEVSLTKAAQQVRAKPRIQAPEADEVKSAALRFARWQREIDNWTRQTKKVTRWLQENPTERLGPYAPRAAVPCAELRAALQAALQEISGEEQ